MSAQHAEPTEEGAIRVRASAPADDEARDRFVLEAPHGTIFHLSGWRRVIERVMGHEGRDLVAEREGELVGVLPLMRCKSLFGAGKLISMPYAVYGGPAGKSAAVERALYAEAERRAVAENARRLGLRCLHEPDLGTGDLARSELYATFLRELPDDPADVLARMPKKARAEARKATLRNDSQLRTVRARERSQFQPTGTTAGHERDGTQVHRWFTGYGPVGEGNGLLTVWSRQPLPESRREFESAPGSSSIGILRLADGT